MGSASRRTEDRHERHHPLLTTPTRKEIEMTTTELATSEAQEADSVEVVTEDAKKPPQASAIDVEKLATIVKLLCDAYRDRKGLFAQTTIETHAPQHKWYPGSPLFKRVTEEAAQDYAGLTGVGLPSSDEVQAAIRDYTEKLFAASGEKLEVLGEEIDISAVEVTKEQGAHIKRLQALFKAAEKRESLEAEATFVPTKTIERGTLEHRRWLWFATLTDRREVSDLVYRAHCRIFEDYPELYDERIANADAEDFKEKIRRKSYKIGSPYQSAEFWIRCGKTLFEDYGGDPVVLLKMHGWSVESVYRWKMEQKKERGYDPIPGWGRKLLSLYFLYLAELGYKMPKDVFPADVHAQAILLQTEAVDFGTKEVIYTSSFAEMIRKEVPLICKKQKNKVIVYGHASWLLGSQLCVNCAGNAAVPYLCPIYAECKGRVDTSSYFAKGIWRKGGQVMAKGGERPAYGIPTNFSPRERTRTGRQTKVIPITPLFGK